MRSFFCGRTLTLSAHVNEGHEPRFFPSGAIFFFVLLLVFCALLWGVTLGAYRQRESIPLNWLVGASDEPNIDALLESIGFQSASAGTAFMRRNLVVFLDPNLRVAKWINGTDYTASDVHTALRVARGETDWIGRHFEWLYAILVFGAALLCVLLVSQFVRPNAAVVAQS